MLGVVAAALVVMMMSDQQPDQVTTVLRTISGDLVPALRRPLPGFAALLAVAIALHAGRVAAIDGIPVTRLHSDSETGMAAGMRHVTPAIVSVLPALYLAHPYYRLDGLLVTNTLLLLVGSGSSCSSRTGNGGRPSFRPARGDTDDILWINRSRTFPAFPCAIDVTFLSRLRTLVPRVFPHGRGTMENAAAHRFDETPFPVRRAVSDTGIETLRVAATVLLVAFHAVGSENNALMLGPMHPLQLANAFLVDIRMPLFAFIAGYVYALRPIGTGRLGDFALGKSRRLLVPGAVAVLAFAVASTMFDRRFATPLNEIWRVLLYPYAHFWFLQAIFLILLGVALAEKLVGERVMLPVFVLASLALVLEVEPGIRFFSIRHATYLLPYFALGVVVRRHRNLIDDNRTAALGLALAFVVVACAWNLHALATEGALSVARRDLQSWMFGTGVCLAGILLPIGSRRLAAFGIFSFTIYLYHIFGTAGAREILMRLGVGNIWVLFVASITAGLAAPAVLHLVAARSRLSRRLVLGLR